jgi:tetratricopeptide (TPR) repeat protein
MRDTSTRRARRKKVASVRMSPGGYFAVAAILTFTAVICLRTHRDLLALILIAGTWTSIPFLILTDRLVFDGLALKRTGLSALLERLLRRRLSVLTISDVERVDVTSMRTLRRGGNVRYRYRVDVMGNDCVFTFTSGGKQFRRMVHAVFPHLDDHRLDARARELRDHLVETKAVRADAERLGIAPNAVLENATAAVEKRIEKHRRDPASVNSEAEMERSVLLRRAANDLRISGRLQQSAEAFRRALLITPRNGWLIYEYARLLKSQASAFSNARLLSRACAALALAARRESSDARLLERVGETFLEYCDPARAAKTFRRALEVDENSYRAQLGLAEVALTQGKLAHVIHHYNDAVRIAPDKPSARLARRESEYYSCLNNDEGYLAAEVRRMNWLEAAARIQRLTARVSFGALLVALVGSSLDQFVGGIGWAIASSSIIAWSGSLVVRRLLSTRRRLAVDA